MHISSGINGNRNRVYDADPIPLETWTSVVIEQKQEQFCKNQVRKTGFSTFKT